MCFSSKIPTMLLCQAISSDSKWDCSIPVKTLEFKMSDDGTNVVPNIISFNGSSNTLLSPSNSVTSSVGSNNILELSPQNQVLTLDNNSIVIPNASTSPTSTDNRYPDIDPNDFWPIIGESSTILPNNASSPTLNGNTNNSPTSNIDPGVKENHVNLMCLLIYSHTLDLYRKKDLKYPNDELFKFHLQGVDQLDQIKSYILTSAKSCGTELTVSEIKGNGKSA